MGNENNIQTFNPEHKNDNNANRKRKNFINNSKLSYNLKNKKNLMDFIIKVENGILLDNLNLPNSITLNNLCIPKNTLKKDQINYIQSINDFTDLKLDTNKKLNMNYNNDQNKFIRIINDISKNNYKNIYHKKSYESQVYNKKYIENKDNSFNYENNKNASTIETTYKKNININNIQDGNDPLGSALKNLKIFKIGNTKENNNINNTRKESQLYGYNSPYSLKTYNSNQKRNSNVFSNISEYNNNSFLTSKNEKIIYNNRMIIASPVNSKKERFRKIMEEENKYLKDESPKDNIHKHDSPKNNSRNKNKISKTIDINNYKINNNINIHINHTNTTTNKKNNINNINNDIKNSCKKIENQNKKERNIKKLDIKINKKPLIKEIKSKSPFTKRKKFDNKKLFKNRNIEESFLSGKEEDEQNKSFDYNMKDFNKKNRYMNMFNENKEKNKNKSDITQMANKKKNIKKLNPYNINGRNLNGIDNQMKYLVSATETDRNTKNKIESTQNIIFHKSPPTFRKKVIIEKPLFKKKIISENKKNNIIKENNILINDIEKDKEKNLVEEIINNYKKENKYMIKEINQKPQNNNFQIINKEKVNTLENIIEEKAKDKKEEIIKENKINNLKNIENNINNKISVKNDLNVNNAIKNKNVNKKKKPKKKIFDDSPEQEEIKENKVKNEKEKNDNNNINDNIFSSFAPKQSDFNMKNNNNIEETKENKLLKELKEKLNERNKKKEENNKYKSNDLEKIINKHKNEQNKIDFKKNDSNINTIFTYIENNYNLNDEENNNINNNNINNDRSFSFRKKLTGNSTKEEKKNNSEIEKGSENIDDDKEKERESKFSFKINSDINESEFNDINYL